MKLKSLNKFTQNENKEIVLKTGKKILLRMIKPQDVDGIWQNFNEVVEDQIYLPVYTPVKQEWEKISWYQDLIDMGNFCIVAEDLEKKRGNSIVGQITIENVMWEAAEHVGILGIIIQKDYRNQGLGQKIIEHAKNIAKSRGKKKLILTSLSDNEISVNLYEKCGFEVVGKYKKQYYIKDYYVDEILMECFLKKF